MFRLRGEVTFEITNTGERAAAAVPQLYVGTEKPQPGRPLRKLAGFQKIPLAPGDSRIVEIEIPRSAFEQYIPGKGWKFFPATYLFVVGESSRDLRLQQARKMTAWAPEH